MQGVDVKGFCRQGQCSAAGTQTQTQQQPQMCYNVTKCNKCNKDPSGHNGYTRKRARAHTHSHSFSLKHTHAHTRGYLVKTYHGKEGIHPFRRNPLQSVQSVMMVETLGDHSCAQGDAVLPVAFHPQASGKKIKSYTLLLLGRDPCPFLESFSVHFLELCSCALVLSVVCCKCAARSRPDSMGPAYYSNGRGFVVVAPPPSTRPL